MIVGMVALPSLAFAAPGIPAQFYGTVQNGSGTTSSGLTVDALINGVVVATTVTQSSGNYGSSPNLLIIPDANGTLAGTTVTFKVNGVAVSQTATFANALLTHLDLAISSSAQVLSENTTVSTSYPEILVGSSNITSSTITIPSSVTNATINISAITTSTANSTTATIQAPMTINASTAIGAVDVEIPAGLQITAGTPTWNGVINVPQIKENSTVTATPDSGNTAAVSSVIEIGYGDTKLTFSKAVRIKIAGQAGKYVGYSRGGVFTTITSVCSADSQTAGDALSAEGDCKISVGSDMIIWTKHFTNFVTYTQAAISTPTPAPSGGGGGGGGGGSVTTTATTNTATTSTNTLTSVTKKADTNVDGKVDFLDFNSLMVHWGQSGANVTGDFNSDNVVDFLDFNMLMVNWTKI